MTAEESVPLDRLVRGIAQIISQARGQVRQAVNSAMVQSYLGVLCWN